MRKRAKRVVIDVVANGRKGGIARARKLTPAQRTAAARKAVNIRWARAAAQKKKGQGGRAGGRVSSK